MTRGRQNYEQAIVRSNRVVAAVCAAVFIGMVGLAYAAVPLYELFCRVTGYGGTTQRVEQYSDQVLERMITVRFDANVAGGLPWHFRPLEREVRLKIGETVQIAYEAENIASRPAAGRATFNVTPHRAGSFFNKVECFCFVDTTLQSGEAIKMPVVFFVDPAIADVPELANLTTITLSYTFFPAEKDEPVAGTVPSSAGATNGNTHRRIGE
jgi:cytochrome c oxidase assembly protein subunit 11